MNKSTWYSNTIPKSNRGVRAQSCINFPYIFYKFDSVEWQKMCGKTKVLQKLITNFSALQI